MLGAAGDDAHSLPCPAVAAQADGAAKAESLRLKSVPSLRLIGVVFSPDMP